MQLPEGLDLAKTYTQEEITAKVKALWPKASANWSTIIAWLIKVGGAILAIIMQLPIPTHASKAHQVVLAQVQAAAQIDADPNKSGPGWDPWIMSLSTSLRTYVDK